MGNNFIIKIMMFTRNDLAHKQTDKHDRARRFKA